MSAKVYKTNNNMLHEGIINQIRPERENNTNSNHSYSYQKRKRKKVIILIYLLSIGLIAKQASTIQGDSNFLVFKPWLYILEEF